MRSFGTKQIFAIEYEILDKEDGYGSLELWVDNKEICCFNAGDKIYKHTWYLSDIVEWLILNKDSIINEIVFPLPVQANTSIEFYNKCSDFESNDFDEDYMWFKKRQDWKFRHSWLSTRGGSYLADVVFRRVNDTIEVEWDNTNLYEEVHFINPKGIYYVDINLFEQVINDFVEDFLEQLLNSCKTFAFWHNPYEATGFFAKKVDFLKKMGFTFKYDAEYECWRVVREL